MPKTLAPKETRHTEAAVGRAVELVQTGEVPSYYTNNTQVETSVWDIRLRFAETLEIDRDRNITRVRELATVRMSPQHARVIVNILLQHLERYEKDFGAIPAAPTASDK